MRFGSWLETLVQALSLPALFMLGAPPLLGMAGGFFASKVEAPSREDYQILQELEQIRALRNATAQLRQMKRQMMGAPD